MNDIALALQKVETALWRAYGSVQDTMTPTEIVKLLAETVQEVLEEYQDE